MDLVNVINGLGYFFRTYVEFKIDDKILSFSCVFKNGYHRYTLYYQFNDANIELVKNLDEDIRAVLLETHMRLNGTWEAEAGDEENQEIFRSYYS